MFFKLTLITVTTYQCLQGALKDSPLDTKRLTDLQHLNARLELQPMNEQTSLQVV